MYLILEEEEALKRNKEEAQKRACQAGTNYWWAMTYLEGSIALYVEGGDGLTSEEKSKCVDELPELK